MAIEIRKARVADIPHMAHFAVQAFGGFGEVMYEGAIPGRSAQQVMEYRFANSGATSSIANSRIAEAAGEVLGGLHAFPMDDAANDPEDILIPDERHPVFAPFDHAVAAGSYYINIVAVYPQFRGRGVAGKLVEEAEEEATAGGFATASLHVFDENRNAVGLYARLGYREAARLPLVPHPSLHYEGDLLVMTKSL